MTDLFEIIAEFSYVGIFFLFVALNAAPILMPPTWIVLSSFYAIDPSLNPLILSLVGATGATLGRFLLKQISGLFRKFVAVEQKSNLDIVGNYLNKKKYGYVVASFLFAATPLPDNVLFIAYGLMKSKSIGMYLGFWVGRAMAYYVMISVSSVVLMPFTQIFEDRLTGILYADLLGIVSIVLFAFIDWGLLITKKKLKFVKPKLWRL